MPDFIDRGDPQYIRLADAVHEAIAINGCKHPKWKQFQCNQVADDLWSKGLRFQPVSEPPVGGIEQYQAEDR